MSVTLINGDGNPRVLASQDADWYGALTGQKTCIVPINDNLSATITDSNTIEISSGVCITKEGRRVQIDEGDIEEIIIPTGTQGTDTYYIIGFHLYINESGQQVAETFVETMASATDTITETTFKEGSSSIYVSLYRVKRSGLLMDSVTRIIPILRTIAELDNTLGTTDISAIGDGTVTGGISQLNSDLIGKQDALEFIDIPFNCMTSTQASPYPYRGVAQLDLSSYRDRYISFQIISLYGDSDSISPTIAGYIVNPQSYVLSINVFSNTYQTVRGYVRLICKK